MSIENSSENKIYKIPVEKDKKYSLCSCGHSTTMPLCDGSHKIKSPEFRSIKYIADADKIIYFCTCEKSKSGILCDGSHN